MKIKDIGSLRAVRVSPAELDRRLGELGGRLRRRGGRFTREPIPSGSLTLDRATGLGGLPRGRLIALTGTNRGNHEVLATAVAETQKRGGVVAVIDAAGLGRRLTGRSEIDTRELLVTRPRGAVEALEIARTLVDREAADLLLLPVPVPRDEDESAEVRRALRRLAAALKGSSTCVVLVDRAAPAKRRAAKLSLDDLRRLTDLGLETRSGAKTPTGRRIQLEIAAESVFGSVARRRSADVEIERGGGLSRLGDLLDGATAEDLIERRGSVYRYGDVLLGRGRESSKRTLAGRPELALEIESMLERATADTRRRVAAAVAHQGSHEPIEPPVEPTDPVNTAHTDLPGGDADEAAAEDSAVERELAAAAAAERERRRREAFDLSDPGPSELAPAPRFVNTWFADDEEPVLPLTLGRASRFHLQIGHRRSDDPGAAVAPFVEPDWGGHDELHLLVSLYSADLRIEPRQQDLLMPRRGDSAVLDFTVTPLAAGTCRLRIVVSLAKELEVLQRLHLEVEAVAAPVAAGAGAG